MNKYLEFLLSDKMIRKQLKSAYLGFCGVAVVFFLLGLRILTPSNTIDMLIASVSTATASWAANSILEVLQHEKSA